MDYSAIAQQYGGTTVAPAPNATSAVDYNAIAQKYGAVSTPPPENPVASFAKGIYSGVASPLINILARPGQAVSHLIGNTEPQSGDVPIGFGASVHVNDPVEDIQNGKTPLQSVTSDVGRAAQTVALGLGPVAGGATYGGGAALEQNKPILPTFQGDNLIDKGVNLAADNVVGNAALGAGVGKLSAVGTKIAGKAIAKTGEGLKAIGGGADALYGSAQRNIEKVLAPTTKTNKLITQKLAPQAAREGLPVSLTRSSLLEKLQTTADQTGEKIDNVWANLPANSKVNVRPIVDSLEKAMNDLKIHGANGELIPSEQQPYFEQLSAKAEELKSLADANGDADAQAIRAYRQSLDQAVAKNKSTSFGFSPTDTAKMAGTKLTTNTTRGEIAKQVPGIAAPNKQFNLNQGLADVLDATITRKTGQSTPLGEKIMEGVGGAAGYATHGVFGGLEYGIVAKMASKVINSTAWQTASAAAKKSLADAIASGDSTAIATALKTGFKFAGTGLEHVGNFIQSLPDAASTLPRAAIPGTALPAAALPELGAKFALPAAGLPSLTGGNPFARTITYTRDQQPAKPVKTSPPPAKAPAKAPEHFILDGVDISPWATDPHHEQGVANIHQSLPDFSSPKDIHKYITTQFPKSTIKGVDIADAASRYKVNPKLLLSILQQDSSLGTKGLGKKTNNPGNVGNDDAGRIRRFKSMREGVMAAAALLAKMKVGSSLLPPAAAAGTLPATTTPQIAKPKR